MYECMYACVYVYLCIIYVYVCIIHKQTHMATALHISRRHHSHCGPHKYSFTLENVICIDNAASGES